MKHLFRTAPLSLIVLLAACGGAGAAAPKPASTPAAKPYIAPPTPPKLNKRGLESVLGADEASLVSQFGRPRLDVVEVNGRKLQFVGEPCILDAYLYLDERGQERVTYVDARNRDGAAVDRAACVEALRADK